MNKPLFRFVTAILGSIFIYAGAIKIGETATFADQINVYQILPEGWIPLAAITLPVLEILAGLWLVSGWRIRPPLFTVMGMLCIFIIALVSGGIRGLSISCGCFGKEEHGGIWVSLLRDLILFALAYRCFLESLIRDARSPSCAKLSTDGIH